MTNKELLEALLVAEDSTQVKAAVDRFVEATHDARWIAVGARPNNRGVIEVSSNPGRAVVERVTNAIDAVLDAEFIAHDGKPAVGSPGEAATTWLNVPDDGLSGMTAAERRRLAKRVTVRLRSGSSPDKRVIEIHDRGIGLSAEQMPTTILSLNESNKVQKLHQAGTYGQGGSATFAAAEYSLIVSRRPAEPESAFTVVHFEPPPADQIKGGSYVFLVVSDTVPAAETEQFDSSGTLCCHYGYDLTKFPSPLGPNSVYGLLQQVLFDPVLPIWFENKVHNYNRVIKGSRNALNGAVDEGDDDSSKLSHHMNMFYVSLGDFGRVGIEYWVLDRGDKKNKRPSAAYVDPHKPIILTLNGQNQAEMGIRLVRKDADLPYLAQRLICHVDCNSLSAPALRGLFSSNREEARAGNIHAILEREVVAALKSDDDLSRLNAEARDKKYDEADEEASITMRKEVAKLLRLQGFEVTTEAGATRGQGAAGDRASGRRGRGRQMPPPVELHEPPTYIKILWPQNELIGMHPGQRRYVRIETDANSKYHDPKNPVTSGVNIALIGDGIRQAGTTALSGGRMRVLVTCDDTVHIGSEGSVTVELKIPGRPTLSDSRQIVISDPPPSRMAQQRIVMPPFDVRAVEGPDDEMWATLAWPDDPKVVASSAVHEDDKLVVYYSKVFPRFSEFFEQLKAKDAASAVSFEKRYTIWLAVHSLIIDRENQEASADDSTDTQRSDDDNYEDEEARERRERCRVATLAAMMAVQEIKRTSAPIAED